MTDLDLGNNHLGDEGVGRLAASPISTGLHSLNLSNTGLTDAGVQTLTSSGLEQLRSLRLRWNGIESVGVRSLAQSLFWPKLLNLDLTCTAIADAGAGELLAVPPPTWLNSLIFVGTDISPSLQQALRDHFGPSVCRFD